MVSKKHLLAMILDLSDEIQYLDDKLQELEKEVHKPKPIRRGTNTDGVKRKPGRPKKSA